MSNYLVTVSHRNVAPRSISPTVITYPCLRVPGEVSCCFKVEADNHAEAVGRVVANVLGIDTAFGACVSLCDADSPIVTFEANQIS